MFSCPHRRQCLPLHKKKLKPNSGISHRAIPSSRIGEELLNDLHHLLTTNQTTTLTQPPAISGLGGIGKTQTALEYIYRYRSKYQQVFWVKADIHEELVTDLVAIAGHLHLPQQYEQDQNIILAATKRWLETHTGWLLFLDNADDLKTISPYLPVGSAGHILLTTRAQTMGGIAHKVNVTTMEKRRERFSSYVALVTFHQEVRLLMHKKQK